MIPQGAVSEVQDRFIRGRRLQVTVLKLGTGASLMLTVWWNLKISDMMMVITMMTMVGKITAAIASCRLGGSSQGGEM